MRLNGLFTQTENFFHIPVGPFAMRAGGWGEWNVTFPTRLEQRPYIIAQPVTGYALVANITDVTESGCKLVVNNLSQVQAVDCWIDVIALPLRRA